MNYLFYWHINNLKYNYKLNILFSFMNNLRLYNWNLTIWIFDFDGNILNTDTPLYLKNKITWDIESIFAHETDKNPNNFFWENSIYEIVPETYCEARDFFLNDIHRWFNWLEDDVNKAINENNFAPWFDSFKDMYLKKARIFSILTARWNSSDNFQKVLTIINEKTLTEEEKEEQYNNILNNFNLDKKISRQEALYYYFWRVVNYIPCNNPQIEKIMNFEWLTSAERKAKSIDFLLSYYIKLLEKKFSKEIENILLWKSLSVGFSDDSLENIISVYKKFRSMIENWEFLPDVSKKFSVYFTGDKFKKEELLNLLWDDNYDLIEKELWLKIKLLKK